MEKTKKAVLKFSFFSFMSLLMLLNSCQNDNETQIQLATEINKISKENAIDIAKNLTLTEQKSSKFSKGAESKKIGIVFPILTKKNETAFYVINYQNGGFIIVSADNRNSPILAFSDNSTFQKDTLNYPEGLKDWLYFQTKNIENIKTENKPQSEIKKQEWNQVNRIAPNDPTVCPNDVVETVGPLLSSTWGQWYGYNNLVPFECIGNPNNRSPTGCVATAMAQIMKYYQKPSTYNWANMPSSYGTNDTAILMRDIGGAVRMSYGCNGSSANSEDEIASTFRDDFHYSNASGGDYNYQVVVQQLRVNKPVILTGGVEKKMVFLGICIQMVMHGFAMASVVQLFIPMMKYKVVVLELGICNYT